jgi:hypothetical protein
MQDPIEKTTIADKKEGQGHGSSGRELSIKCEALSSNPSTVKKKGEDLDWTL